LPEIEYEFITVDDQNVDISEGLTLEIGGPFPILGKHGNVLSVELNLGKAQSFVSFNKTSKTLMINEGFLRAADVGRYKIVVLARY